MSAASDDAQGRQWIVVAGLGVAQTLAFASSYYLPAIIADSVARDLRIAPPYFFAAFSLALGMSAFLGPVCGRHIDRHGGRGLLSLSNLIFAVGLLALAAAQGPLSLFLAWFALGLAMAIGLYESAFSTLAAIYGGKARAPITGVTLIAGFASTVGWPLTTYFEWRWGWRGACIAWSALHLTLGLALNWFCIPSIARFHRAGDHERKPLLRAATHEYRAPGMIALAIVFALSMFISSCLSAHLPRLLELSGATAATALLAASLMGPAQVAARLFEFGLMRRFHPLFSARAALMLHPAGAAALLAFGAPLAMLFAILHGFGNGLVTIAKGTLPLALYGPRDYGLRQGLLNAPARVLQAGAPFLFGLFIEAMGVRALAITAVCGLVAFAALWSLSPRTADTEAQDLQNLS